MRFQGKSRLGFYPLPLPEAQRIRSFLQFPAASSAVDPCAGDGVAFEEITSGANVLRYGIELDAYRAEQARERIPNIVQGNTLEVQCPVECAGLLYLNPPLSKRFFRMSDLIGSSVPESGRSLPGFRLDILSFMFNEHFI